MKTKILIILILFLSINIKAQQDSIKQNKFYFSFYKSTSIDYYYSNNNDAFEYTDLQKEHAYRYLFIPTNTFIMLGYKRVELGFGISRFRYDKNKFQYPNYSVYSNHNLRHIQFNDLFVDQYYSVLGSIKLNYMFLEKNKFNLNVTSDFSRWYLSLGLISEFNLSKQTSLFASILYHKAIRNVSYSDLISYNDGISLRLGIKFSNKYNFENYNSKGKYSLNIGSIFNTEDALIVYEPDMYGPDVMGKYITSYYNFVPFIGISKNNNKVIQSLNFAYSSYSDNYLYMSNSLFGYKYSYYKLFYDFKIPILLKNKKNKNIYLGTQLYLEYANYNEKSWKLDSNKISVHTESQGISTSSSLLVGYNASYKYFTFDTGFDINFFKYTYFKYYSNFFRIIDDKGYKLVPYINLAYYISVGYNF